MNMKSLLTVLGLSITAVSAFAQTNTPGVDQRQLNQDQRIQQGAQSGSLTQREENRLERGQNRIDRMENKAKADGNVTPQERKRLQHAENVESRQIYREKHDRQHDFNHDGRNDRPNRGAAGNRQGGAGGAHRR